MTLSLLIFAASIETHGLPAPRNLKFSSSNVTSFPGVVAPFAMDSGKFCATNLDANPHATLNPINKPNTNAQIACRRPCVWPFVLSDNSTKPRMPNTTAATHIITVPNAAIPATIRIPGHPPATCANPDSRHTPIPVAKTNASARKHFPFAPAAAPPPNTSTNPRAQPQ